METGLAQGERERRQETSRLVFVGQCQSLELSHWIVQPAALHQEGQVWLPHKQDLGVHALGGHEVSLSLLS